MGLFGKIAVIVTILGLPSIIYGLYSLIYGTVIVYDMYREKDEEGGYTLVIDEFSRKDFKNGKRENLNREYHKKGKSQIDEANWK